MNGGKMKGGKMKGGKMKGGKMKGGKMKGGKMKGGKMVIYGGAAQQDDRCGGWYETVKGKTDYVAVLIIITSPNLTSAADNWLRNTEYGSSYDLTLDAMGEIFTILDDLSQDLVGRQDVCSGFNDLAWQALGLKNCSTGEAKMNGVIGVIIKYFQQYLGNDNMTGWLTRGFGTAALLTSMRNYISRLLANIICGVYYIGNRGRIESWRLIKIVLQTTTKFIMDVGTSSGRMALAFGGGLVHYISNLSTSLKNDVPTDIDVLDEQIDTVTDASANVENIVHAIDNLENREDEDDDALLDDYEASEEAGEGEVNVEDTITMMIGYLDNALSATENSDGNEYMDHQLLRQGILEASGRLLGDGEEVYNQNMSQPIFEYYDDEMDSGSPLRRATSYEYGGIIDKKDTAFIKNLNKSIQKIKKKYKFKFKNEKKSKKNKNGTKKMNKAGFRNKNRRSSKRSNLLTPFIIKNINTKKRRGSSTKTKKKCSL